MCALLIYFASESTFGQTFGRMTVEMRSVEYAVDTPASDVFLVARPAIAAASVVNEFGRQVGVLYDEAVNALFRRNCGEAGFGLLQAANVAREIVSEVSAFLMFYAGIVSTIAILYPRN